MKWIVAALLAFLWLVPARAAMELVGVDIKSLLEDDRISVEPLSEADTAKMNAAAPNPVPGSAIYLVKAGDSVIVTFVLNSTVMFSSSVFKLATVYAVLGRPPLHGT